MHGHVRRRIIQFIRGIASSVSAHIVAGMAVATATFMWEFAGHVAADVGLRIIEALTGH